MIVAHNFDSDRGFAISVARQGEAGGEFWRRLLGFLDGAGLSPEECFFTNVLMGLKPGKAEGEMPSVTGYKKQCREFLHQQVEIVRPRAVIALGVQAKKYIGSLSCPTFVTRHPKHWYFQELITRNQRLLAEGKAIGKFLDKHKQASVETPKRCSLVRTAFQKGNVIVNSNNLQHQSSGTDVWGFRTGTYNSFLMTAVEAGRKSKETIKSEFFNKYPEASPTTFQTFFSDLVRPFGSASVSRNIRIQINAAGHIEIDLDHALLVKAAIAKGLLKELSRAAAGA